MGILLPVTSSSLLWTQVPAARVTKTKLWPKHTIFKGIQEIGEGIKPGKIIQEMKTSKDNNH